MSKNDGGPAFPMSLRDYAYVKFMAAMLSNSGVVDYSDDKNSELMARLRWRAWAEADAMLEERERQTQKSPEPGDPGLDGGTR